MNALKFQELLRIINCLSGEDFKIIFGEEYKYYLSKLESKGPFDFMLYLDSSNMKAFCERCEEKYEEQKNL